MESIVGVAGLLTTVVVSPGPNNFLVMRAAARQGLAGARATVGAILLGGVVLILLASAGVSAALTSDPLVGRIVTVGGCLYLIWLGGRLIVPGSIGGDEPTATEEAAGMSLLPWAVFGFQFINPKAWVLVLTTMSALQANLDAASALLLLIGLFLVISTPALLLWSLLGSRLASRLRRPRTRALFDRGMGALLVVFALLLLFES